MRRAVLIAGAALLADGLIVALSSNFNLGIILTILIGALILAYGVFFRTVNSARGPLKWLRNLGLAGLGCLLAMSAFLAVYGNIDGKSSDVDAVIVLGAAVHGNAPSLPLTRRLERAAEFHGENPEALIVVTGGKGAQEDISEAEAMRDYLLAHGVAADRIILEDRAVSTRENFRFSKALLDERLGKDYRTAVITNDFHIYRAGLVAKSEGFGKIARLHSRTEWYTWPQNYIRESLAVVKTWIFG